MKNHKTSETLGFNHFHDYNLQYPYYGTMSQNNGYGGFDYSNDFLFMNREMWTQPNGFGYQQGWCDNGYQNVCYGKGEAFIYESGMMTSANPHETFTLNSMIAAAAWSSDQPWAFNSYVYRHGSLVLKATDTIYLIQSGKKIEFAKIGGKGDFSNISAFSIVMEGLGQRGNGCTLGTGTYGYQIAFDNVKVAWNGKIPAGDVLAPHRHAPLPHAGHVIASPLPILKSEFAFAGHGGESGRGLPGGFHSELTSLDSVLGHGGTGNPTDQFVLPQPEHFGT